MECGTSCVTTGLTNGLRLCAILPLSFMPCEDCVDQWTDFVLPLFFMPCEDCLDQWTDFVLPLSCMPCEDCLDQWTDFVLPLSCMPCETFLDQWTDFVLPLSCMQCEDCLDQWTDFVFPLSCMPCEDCLDQWTQTLPFSSIIISARWRLAWTMNSDFVIFIHYHFCPVKISLNNELRLCHFHPLLFMPGKDWLDQWTQTVLFVHNPLCQVRISLNIRLCLCSGVPTFIQLFNYTQGLSIPSANAFISVDMICGVKLR